MPTWATSSKIQHNSMLELVLKSQLHLAENLFAFQHYENKFKNGTYFIKNETPYDFFVKIMKIMMK